MIAAPAESAARAAPEADAVLRRLNEDGIAIVPGLVDEQLPGMQRAFAARLKRLRFNNVDGYEKTERYRHMVPDVLMLHQGFVDLALHPLVKEVVRRYVGPDVALTEAKGWLSLPTKRDFHGWHGDAWYDQARAQGIPREVKVALYLTDVKSGYFCYVKGSHQKEHPRGYRRHEVDAPPERVVEVKGLAGTAVLFDTSGIHRQAAPILEPRQAVFYNYHDPKAPLQQEDVDYYRYHPLLLNAAFLGGLTAEDQKMLGFGDKTNYQEGFERRSTHPGFEAALRRRWNLRLWLGDVLGRIAGRLGRLFGRR
jgi:hypothetical protein